MDSTDSAGVLIEAGALSADDLDSVELSGEYAAAVEVRRQVPEDRRVATIREHVADADGVPALSGVDAGLLAHLCALAERVPELPFETLLRAALVVQSLEAGAPPTDGVPEGYVPVRGDQLPSVLQLYDRAVVYVWRENCPPCDVMVRDLEALSADLTSGMGQFAVYGPNWARPLQEEYDVVGGPALLFVARGGVRSRLYEAAYPEAIEAELRALGNA